MRLKLFVMFSVMTGIVATLAIGQAPPPAQPAKPAAPKPAAPKAASPVDQVIDLVNAGMSESLIIKSLQAQNKPAALAPADLVRLQKAGVSENIINVMMDPKAASAPAAAAVRGAGPSASAPGSRSSTPTRTGPGRGRQSRTGFAGAEEARVRG